MMQKLQTEVLVIGGGATGAGVVRDLAMRGFQTILVERGDLTHGTTGRYHGLLHSGGRYVVKDPQAAKECIEENRILRRIMPACIEETGGFFVVTPWDEAEYAPRFLAGCQAAGIPVEELSITQMLREEPLLNPRISRCFRVPDASADSFLAADLNAASARQHRARILPYYDVIRLLTSGSEQGSQRQRVVGALCHDLVNDEEVEIYADSIVNASGAWAGKIAASIGIPVQIIPGKGSMIAINHRILNTVVNRCKMPADGDIIVPAHTVAVVGTTDVPVIDPDHFSIEPWEINLMLEEGDKLVPGLKEMRILRAWAGVRPLYKETHVSDTRDVTRAYVLLDHEKRDGLPGMVTITSGKWTTYRKMAEVTVDLVCEKLGVKRPCRTHLEPLPDPDGHGKHYLGHRLAKIEEDVTYGELICECELVTRAEVERVINTNDPKTIDDVRRDVRVGMGPCQGGFCTYRVAGLLHRLRHPDIQQTNVALRDFLQERWKGLLPILWGQQLRQELLDELIYLGILNADHLPGPKVSRLSPVLYDVPGVAEDNNETGELPVNVSPGDKKPDPALANPLSPPANSPAVDVLVVGAGLSGLAAAWQVAARGQRVHIISKGMGSQYWKTGCVDVLGFYPIDSDEPVESPADNLRRLIQAQPRHPYALAVQTGGQSILDEALRTLQDLSVQAGYPLRGSIDRNWLFPSALGTFRPTCLAPETMVDGDLRLPEPMLLVGFAQFPDFYPELIADNLSAQGVPARGVTLDLPVLNDRRFVTSRTLADLFDQPDFRSIVANGVHAHLSGEIKRVGFPAVWSLDHPLQVKQELEDLLGMPVFEIPTLPPSIPGIRLSKLLVKAIEKAGGRVYDGMQVVSIEAEGSHMSTMTSEAASRCKQNRASRFILATGGLLGGGFKASYDGQVREVVADLPVFAPLGRENWLERQFFSPTGHPIFRAGLGVNSGFQPVDLSGEVIYENLYAVGGVLSEADLLRERSLDGVGLVTGYLVGKTI
jgi:glycerol-3-phosphate dehydrogenase